MLHPQVGLLGRWLNRHGIAWDYKLHGGQAMLVVILASAWKQVSYDFIFFLAGLQSIPRAVIEAARMDGARGWRRFRTITLPLLAPTMFFLLVVNLVYAAFDTFGTIQALTQRRARQGHRDADRQGVPRRRGEPRPRLLLGAVGRADGRGHPADGGAVPLPRAAPCVSCTGSPMAYCCSGCALFALPVWLVLAGSTQDFGRHRPRRALAAARPGRARRLSPTC